jgi:hypothetical protein
MVKKNNSLSGKGSFRKFMKSSQISPHFINDDSNYLPNYSNSHASHASHGVNIIHDDNIRDDENYHSNTTLDSDNIDNSDDNSDNNDDNDDNSSDNDHTNDTQVDDSYSSITKTKDLKIFKMKNLLAQKRKILFHKEQEIKEMGKQNSFLESVIRDYEKYNTTILEEKQKQKKALKILSKHIRAISKNINNDESHLSHVKNDQTLLLDEIEKIRDEIAYVLNTRGIEYHSSDADNDEEYEYEDQVHVQDYHHRNENYRGLD